MTIKNNKPQDLSSIILSLYNYWVDNGCSFINSYDLEMGAGTFHPATVFGALSNKSSNIAYTQPCRRPTDGRYAQSPNRLSHYYQFQVLMKPAPLEVKKLYLNSLEHIGIDIKKHDIRFVEDDWESPTLGAWGLGWEVWCDGMEITQFTYFQQVGGCDLKQTPVEITYGLERIAMYILEIDNVYDLPWDLKNNVSYGDIFLESEKEFSKYNFEEANTSLLMQDFKGCEDEVVKLLNKNLIYPAYHNIIKATNSFNLLDSRGVISVNERRFYIEKIQTLVKKVCEKYLEKQKENE